MVGEEFLHIVAHWCGAKISQRGDRTTAAKRSDFFRQVVPVRFQVVPCNLACRAAEKNRKEPRVILLANFALVNKVKCAFYQCRLPELRKNKEIRVRLRSRCRAIHALAEF